MKDLLTAILAILFTAIVYVLAIKIIDKTLNKTENVQEKQKNDNINSGEPTTGG